MQLGYSQDTKTQAANTATVTTPDTIAIDELSALKVENANLRIEKAQAQYQAAFQEFLRDPRITGFANDAAAAGNDLKAISDVVFDKAKVKQEDYAIDTKTKQLVRKVKREPVPPPKDAAK